jgi:large subunit ribosomal protein L2
LKTGETVVAGENVEVKTGNSLMLVNIPVGTLIHNIELIPGRGGQIVRSAGSSAIIMAKEDNFAQIKMPSGEIRKILNTCFATIGQVGNIEWKNIHFGKAGRKRHMGIRPSVRGTAQDPRSHPHGGGEGRSGVGMKYPKTPWGKHALGTKTRKKNKPSSKFIIKRRR